MSQGGRAWWAKEKEAAVQEHAVLGEAEWVPRVNINERSPGISSK